jgi:hypothetical protein
VERLGQFQLLRGSDEDGCNDNDPEEVTFSTADLARIQEARADSVMPAGPKAKKAKKTAGMSDASVVSKKRGRGRPRKSDDEEVQDTVAIEDADEEEGAQPP